MCIDWTAQNLLMARLVNTRDDFLFYDQVRKEQKTPIYSQWETDELEDVFQVARELDEEDFTLIGFFFRVKKDHRPFVVELFTADVSIRFSTHCLQYQIEQTFKQES